MGGELRLNSLTSRLIGASGYDPGQYLNIEEKDRSAAFFSVLFQTVQLPQPPIIKTSRLSKKQKLQSRT